MFLNCIACILLLGSCACLIFSSFFDSYVFPFLFVIKLLKYFLPCLECLKDTGIGLGGGGEGGAGCKLFLIIAIPYYIVISKPTKFSAPNECISLCNLINTLFLDFLVSNLSVK